MKDIFSIRVYFENHIYYSVFIRPFYSHIVLKLLSNKNHKMNENLDEYKVTALLREYSDQRAEIRLFEVLAIVCIVISILASSALLLAGVLSKEYILLWISPAVSIFFIILAMALGAYVITLVMRLTDIEYKANKILKEGVLEFSSSFFLLRPDVIEKGIGKYWTRIVWMGLVTGIIPFIISVWLGITLSYLEIGPIAWLASAAYSAIAIMTIYVGYRFFLKLAYLNVQTRA